MGVSDEYGTFANIQGSIVNDQRHTHIHTHAKNVCSWSQLMHFNLN